MHSRLPEPRLLDPATPPTMATLVLMAGLGAVSMNIIVPSLPAIRAAFGAEVGTVQFLLSGYLMVNGLLMLLIGPLSDRFGRRPLALASLAVFVVASIVCATARSIEVLVAARVAQALVVSMLVLSRAAVRDMLPAQRAAAMLGYVAMGMSVAPMLAPSLGGALQEGFGWPAPFWALAIGGVLILLLVWRDFGETNIEPSASLLAQVRQYPTLLVSRRFWGYTISTAFASGCFFTFLGGAPFVGTEVYGLSPGALGMWFIFPPAGYFVGNFVTGRLSHRVGLMPMMIAGATLVIIGMAVAWVLVAILEIDHPAAFFAPTVAIGLGNGLAIPNGSAGMMNVNPRLAGTAAGLGGAIMTLGGAAMSAAVVPFLSAEAGAAMLILFIAASGIVSLCAALYAAAIERQVALSAA